MRRPSGLLGVLLTLAACATSHPAAPTAMKRLVITAGHQAGTEIVSAQGNERQIDFEYNDRGRGPKTHTVLTTDDRSVTRSLRTTGVDYLKAPVDESFTAAHGEASWTNGAEKDRAAERNAFYVSMYGPPEETAVLARALLLATNHRLPLLPAGEASIERVGELTLSSHGESRRVGCYEISGLGFTPYQVWLDDHNEFFATASTWTSVIADGWDATIPQLIAAQDRWRDAAVSASAHRLAHHPAGGIAIIGARLFDPVTLQTTAQTTIVVRGNRIESVGRDDSVVIPDGVQRINAEGRTVIPGLWDMHTHNGADDGLLNLASGVTTVRDLANDIDFLLDLRAKIERGDAVGPRILLAGIIDGKGPYAGPTKMLIDSEEEARAAIDKYASLGYEQIKIYSSVRPELVPAMTRMAHEHGMRVSGHVPAYMRAEDAVRAGFDELQHANFLILNFLPDVKDTRTPVRFTAPAERAALLDLQSPAVRSFIELLKNRPCDAAWDARNTPQNHYHCQPTIVIDPTLSIFEEFFVARKGVMAPGYAAIADRLPPQVRRGFLTGGLSVPEGMDQRYRDSFEVMLSLTRMLHDAGVTIVAGTDAMAGFSLHRELELYVRAGIPPAEVLRLATLGAAEVMHHDDQLGSVSVGKLADLVILDGDPVADIHNIRKVVTVIKDGNVYDAKEIDAEIGVH